MAGASVGRFWEAVHYLRGISDHSLVGVTLLGPSQFQSVPPRLDPWNLRDKSFLDKLRARATQYFEENLGSVDSACALWEAFKTLIRGHVQGMIGSQKKEHNMQAANLEPEIAALEARSVADRGWRVISKHHLKLKCYDLRTLAEQHERAHMLATQLRFNDVGGCH
ncbi:hypothetical protein NDU88_000695 [Pleurodeles waltl]|uniref:Uncharacterized protein n=1 Tax=Pleurodeles waltl TaxID=8319 RepID=A0AAV7P4L9_PLEWA|nr:hypothetical protein NDU88_000695 [Pleurodeles waltl]